MQKLSALLTALSLPALLLSAEFRSGQAARAVIGQSSFSISYEGIAPSSLSIAGGRLFVADRGQRVLAYDLAAIPSPESEGVGTTLSSACSVCIVSPRTVTSQSVLPSVARASVSGSSVAVADPSTHRVLLWRDSRSPKAVAGPDVILGGASDSSGSVNASTIQDPISVALDGHRLFVGDGALHRVLVWNSLPTYASQPADVVLGQADLNSSADQFSAAGRITRPAALVSDGRNLFVADPVNHRVLVFTMSDIPLSDKALVNSATLTHGPLAPGTLVTIQGENFAAESENASDDGEHDLPTSLGGVEVLFSGHKLPLLSVTPNEIRGQLPYQLSGTDSGSLFVRIAESEGSVSISNPISVELRSASPGILAFTGAEPRSGIVVHVNEQNGETSNPVTPTEPAESGQVVVLWAAGLGLVSDSDDVDQAVAGQPYGGDDGLVRSIVEAEIDGSPVRVISATLPRHSIGVYEVRIQLPNDLPAHKSARLTISQGDRRSNTVTLPVVASVQ